MVPKWNHICLFSQSLGKGKGVGVMGGRRTVTHYHNGILCTFLHSERAELCENGKQPTFYTIFTKWPSQTINGEHSHLYTATRGIFVNHLVLPLVTPMTFDLLLLTFYSSLNEVMTVTKCRQNCVVFFIIPFEDCLFLFNVWWPKMTFHPSSSYRFCHLSYTMRAVLYCNVLGNMAQTFIFLI